MATTKTKEEIRKEKLDKNYHYIVTNLNFQSSISNINIWELDFDESTIRYYNLEEFLELEEAILVREKTELCYCVWVNSYGYHNDRKEYKLRICNTIDIVGTYNYYIAPAIKLSEMGEKVKAIVREKNKLGLVKGELSIGLEDIPVQNLNMNNSYYDSKLKRRVPMLNLETTEEKVKREKKEKEPKQEKPKKEKVVKEKREDQMVNNIDVKVEGHYHSSDFLPPDTCTRLWTLRYVTPSEWEWFFKVCEGHRYKSEFYVRPRVITEETKQYDRGGSMVAPAYLKADFPQLDNEILTHDLALELRKEYKENAPRYFGLLVDSFLIKLK